MPGSCRICAGSPSAVGDSSDVAAFEMIVHEPRGLHEGVHRRRADEPKAAPLELLREALSTRASRPAARRAVWVESIVAAVRSSRRAPTALRAARAPRLRCRSWPRSCRGGGRSRASASSRSTSSLVELGDALDREPRERLPEALALAQDRQPREPGLERPRATSSSNSASSPRCSRPHSSSW